MGCKKKSVLIGLAALCAALAVLPFLSRPVKLPTKNPPDEETRAVRLANRVISVPCATTNHWTFPTPSALSRRGTAPFVIVTKKHVTAVERKRAAACGARVTGVIPPYGIVAEVGAAAWHRLRADGSFVAAEPLVVGDKMSDSLKQLVAAGGVGTVPVTMVPLATEDAETVAASIEAVGGQPYEISEKGRGLVRANIPAREVAALAARGDVRWAERHVRPKLLNNVAVQPGLMNVTPVRDVQGLTGSGQVVTLSDSGLDTGNPATMMADFTNRIAFLQTVNGCQSDDRDGHGTHVAGSLAGDGALSGGEFRGVACGARLNVWQCLASDGYLYFPNEDSLFQPDPVHAPSYIHSGSWGGGVASEYDVDCVNKDDWMWSHPETLAVFAVGNDGRASSIFSPAGAKNVLAVGATESLRTEGSTASDNPSQIASFSSRGPMKDGRIKPDLCTPGSFILSTRSTKITSTGKGLCPTNSHYMFESGTSMATPMASGSAALVRQWLVERRGCTVEMPTAALMKAVLTGGAYDLSHDSGTNVGGAAPNSAQGWGRVDLGESLYPTNASVKLVDRIPFADGESFSLRVTTTNAAPLAVQLVWTDHPGAYGAAQALVNDLDLVVSNETTGAVWCGNGVPGGDHTNTVESVRIASAPAATYSVTVKGVQVPYDCSSGGAAALYVRGAFGASDAQDVWHEDVRGSVTIRSLTRIPSLDDDYWTTQSRRVGEGETIQFTVPESVPGGSETMDLSRERLDYIDEDGRYKRMTIQRLGRIEVAEYGEDSGDPVTTPEGHMATAFSVVADRDRDILYYFYDEASTNVATSLPTWWYQRYVAESPASNQVLFTSVSPSRLEWTGGAGLTRVLERTPVLGASADWQPVYTNAPEPVLTNVWEVPSAFSTNSFYRIVW